MANELVKWPMTSRDLERSRFWPKYISMQISRNPLEIEPCYQWTLIRKWHGKSTGHVTDDVTWPWKVKVMTSIFSWKWLDIQTWVQWSTYWKC